MAEYDLESWTSDRRSCWITSSAGRAAFRSRSNVFMRSRIISSSSWETSGSRSVSSRVGMWAGLLMGSGYASEARWAGADRSPSRDRDPTDDEHEALLGLGPNLGPIRPKHQGEPASTEYQKTRPANKIQSRAESAKPPSPVQIRAAPPIFQFEFDRVCPSGMRAEDDVARYTLRGRHDARGRRAAPPRPAQSSTQARL
jgi:hypothetical protein